MDDVVFTKEFSQYKVVVTQLGEKAGIGWAIIQLAKSISDLAKPLNAILAHIEEEIKQNKQ